MNTLLDRSFSGNFLTRYLSQKAASHLPRRFKRLLFVSSAIGLLMKTKKPDLQKVTKINNRLKLAYSSMGLLFPIYIGSFIWKNLRNNVVRLQKDYIDIDSLDLDNLSEQQLWQTGLFFSRNTPHWLQYGSDNLRTVDLHDMLVELKAA